MQGWLIRHTENQPLKCYALYENDNTIGRPARNYHVDVPIEGDEYVSRIHCKCQIARGPAEWRCTIIDDGGGTGQPSMNGVFINGNAQRLAPQQSMVLRDGDTIQVGLTKLVFRDWTAVTGEQDAVDQVVRQPYTATVALNT